MQLNKFGAVVVVSLSLSIAGAALAKGKSKAGTRASRPTAATLEQLDSATNAFMVIVDNDKAGLCGIAPAEAKKLLMAVHPIFDDKKNAAIAALSRKATGPTGKSIANPKWDESCLKKCHCGLYASILEGVGETRLNASDRAMFDRMDSKARVMTHEHLEVCARTSKWLCESPLLAQLKEEAKNYPDPASAAAAPPPAKASSAGKPMTLPPGHPAIGH